MLWLVSEPGWEQACPHLAHPHSEEAQHARILWPCHAGGAGDEQLWAAPMRLRGSQGDTWGCEAPRHEQGADGALGCCEQALALRWWQGWEVQGMAVPHKCICFSPFSNEAPPSSAPGTPQGCAASPSTHKGAYFVPWATGPATWAVLLLSTPRGAAGMSCPRQGCLSLCTAGAGDKARLLGAAAKLTGVWAGQGAVKWHRGLEGQVHQGCAAWAATHCSGVTPQATEMLRPLLPPLHSP